MRPLIPLLLIALTGCTSYQYQLITPPDLARTIDSKSEQTLDLPPLQFSLITAENRLVMRIKNPTPDPITLAGDKSYVVSPDGQSHPLKTQTIAPQSFIKLILPPMRPYIDRPGPVIGIGIGYSNASRYRRYPYDQPWYWSQPSYSTVYDESDNLLWSWDGQTIAKMLLVFQRNGESFKQELSFKRIKI